MSNVKELVQIEHLSKEYMSGKRTIQALRGVTLNIMRGEAVALMGRSGAGKTTLLEILAGFARPSAGTYIFENERVDLLGTTRLLDFRRVHIGFVPQEYALIDEETTAFNIALPMRLRRWPHDRIAETTAQLVIEFGLEGRDDVPAGNLSGGERQRVALARAMSVRPDLLLADEPTAALDAQSQSQIQALLFGLQRTGTTIVVVTHSHEVARRCNRSIYMEEGKIVACGMERTWSGDSSQRSSQEEEGKTSSIRSEEVPAFERHPCGSGRAE